MKHKRKKKVFDKPKKKTFWQEHNFQQVSINGAQNIFFFILYLENMRRANMSVAQKRADQGDYDVFLCFMWHVKSIKASKTKTKKPHKKSHHSPANKQVSTKTRKKTTTKKYLFMHTPSLPDGVSKGGNQITPQDLP